jgi:RimJ/RimL family protein N-acetyltransferase
MWILGRMRSWSFRRTTRTSTLTPSVWRVTIPNREPANADQIVLQGTHVRLEALQAKHAPALVEAASVDRATYGFTYVPDGIEAMRAYVASALGDRESGRAVPFATVDLATGAVVGTTRFATFGYYAWPAGNAFQRGEHLPDEVEIGWTWLAASSQRSPINTEAKLLMLTHAFESWEVHVVRLKTDSRNERSRSAILRLGARYDGNLRAHSPASDGLMRDSAYFSIVSAEWPAVRAGLERKLQPLARQMDGFKPQCVQGG